MNTHDPFFIAPPPTEVPDYVWSRQYEKPFCLPRRAVKKPQDEGQRISHPDAETALKAAKRACRGHHDRWFGRRTSESGQTEFLVYEGRKVIERHFSLSLH